MKPKIHIASCSFGKDSIATILLALENNEPLDRVVFSEVMFDISRNISGEIPEHIEWIYSTAIPKLEAMGVKVDIVRADTDYMYWFHHIPNGKYKGKKEGFLIGGMCKLNSMCKVKPMKQYYKQFAELKNNHPHLWQELIELSKESNLISPNFKYGMTLQEVERKMNLIEINNKLQLKLEL